VDVGLTRAYPEAVTGGYFSLPPTMLSSALGVGIPEDSRFLKAPVAQMAQTTR
jgi:hypothetical protein